MTVLRCDYCGCSVDLSDGRSGQRVVAWEVRSIDPARKHGRDVILREHLQLFACGTCLEKLNSGLSINQEALQI